MKQKNQKEGEMVQVLVVSHRPFVCPEEACYIPIYVGDKNFSFERGFKDDSGISIAQKNKNYCELTALYWYWKNRMDTADFSGLCHYRRFFTKTPWSNREKHYLSTDDVLEYMKDADIILPEHMNLRCTVFENYYLHGAGKKKDLEIVGNIIAEQCPDYLSSYNAILNRTQASYCNMFVTNNKYFQNYCKWLFDILFEAENRIDLRDYTEQEARIFGYLSEILLNVWVLKNKLKVKYVPVVLTTMNGSALLKHYIKKKFIKRGWISCSVL